MDATLQRLVVADQNTALQQVVVTDQGTTLQHVVVADQNTVLSTAENISVVVTGIMGPPGPSTLGALQDIDRTELVDGATLVYKANTATWKATNRLDSQILEAGQF